MTTVHHVLEALEDIAPPRYAFDFDRVGLQVGDPQQEVNKAVVSLDRSLAAVAHAESVGAQLLVAHHPLIFRPIESVSTRTHVGRTILGLAKANIAFIAAHTNWDSAEGGVNDALCELFKLSHVRAFGTGADVQQLKLVFFCPTENADDVIDACSNAGAGQIGLYTRCAFKHPGTGTFVGTEKANPMIGEKGRIEHVPEVRVEMVLRADQRRAVTRALLRTHPYEQPAFDLFQLCAVTQQSAGRIGNITRWIKFSEFADHLDKTLGTKCLCWGDPEREIRTIAFVGGAADDEWRAAQREEADVLVTGEVKQHNAVEATESGFALVAAGHFATEQPGVAAICARLRSALPNVEWSVFTPNQGIAGRPF
jgi:dinuclear metal center YbgI/SA1388 family protein